MQNSTYKVRSLIICDDVRPEASGKEVLVGAYSGVVVSNMGFPLYMPSLYFRLEVEMEKAQYEGTTLRVLDPQGKQLLISSGNMTFARTDEPASIAVGFSGVIFHQPGNYTVEFALEGTPVPVGRFKVRAADTPIQAP